jgi:pimeloyl-ACP methyl ester carboxylesterase
MKKQKTKLLVTTLILALLCAACSPPDSTAPVSSLGGLEWRACQISSQGVSLPKDALCTRLQVPENPTDPNGRQIELNIARLEAVSKNPAPDPIFFIPGGPGEAATESFVVVASGFEQLWQKRDIILVDQRGTGDSNPLKCPTSPGEPLPEAADGSGNDTAAMAQSLRSCLDSLDADPRFYTTAIAMQDLDRVREVLGYETINLYGASYGTRAALAYMRQYPEHVRTAVLDGVAPTNWALGPSAAANSQRALDALFARCAADPTCHKAYPDLHTEFDTVLETLEKSPVDVDLNHPTSGEPTTINLTRDRFASTVHLMMYAPETAALLPLLIHNAATRQDYARLAALSATNESTLETSLSDGMRYSIMCAEDVPYYPEETTSTGYLGESVDETFETICSVWPRGETPANFHEAVRSDAPTLLISGGADPATPPSNAEMAANTLTNSLHIIAANMGHINLFRGCIPRLVEQFIESGSVDELETDCISRIAPLPFFVNFNGPAP